MLKPLCAVSFALILNAQVVQAEPRRSEPSAAALSGLRTGSPSGPEKPDSVDGRYYSDSFLPLREDVRMFERDPANRYTYCVRNVATYECLSYGSEGAVEHKTHRSTAYGTAFAYQHDGDETRLLTNEHVISWPSVTDSAHGVEGVPSGCKLVSQKLHIVDNEDDEYAEDDIPLKRVVDDRALDAAVVQAKGKLRLLPYRMGRSSALSTGDVVIVRGFPLGVFAAYNTGKIINTLDEDRYKHWDHADFIVDAQLSNGNSGSPVLALNRRTGEYELMGVFHASYTRASSLNAVVAIEQLRELMFQLKAGAKPVSIMGAEPLSDVALRRRLQRTQTDRSGVPFVRLGSLLVQIQAIGETLLFQVFSKDFPVDDRRIVVLQDVVATEGKGTLQTVWFGGDRGYQECAAANLDPGSTTIVRRVLQRLHDLASSTLSYRSYLSHAPDSQQSLKQRSRLQKTLAQAAVRDSELAQQLQELAEDKSPPSTKSAISLHEVLVRIERPSKLVLSTASLAKASERESASSLNDFRP